MSWCCFFRFPASLPLIQMSGSLGAFSLTLLKAVSSLPEFMDLKLFGRSIFSWQTRSSLTFFGPSRSEVSSLRFPKQSRGVQIALQRGQGDVLILLAHELVLDLRLAQDDLDPHQASAQELRPASLSNFGFRKVRESGPMKSPSNVTQVAKGNHRFHDWDNSRQPRRSPNNLFFSSPWSLIRGVGAF